MNVRMEAVGTTMVLRRKMESHAYERVKINVGVVVVEK